MRQTNIKGDKPMIHMSLGLVLYKKDGRLQRFETSNLGDHLDNCLDQQITTELGSSVWEAISWQNPNLVAVATLPAHAN